MSADAPRPDQAPPQDVEAEQAVLGACLLSYSAINDVRRVLTEGDWYRPAHVVIWGAIVRLHAAPGVEVDAVTVAAELTRTGDIRKAGGHSYLHTLIAGVPTAANAGFYAEIVAERAVLRRLLEAGLRIQQMAYGAANGAGMAGVLDDVLGRARDEMGAVRGLDDASERPEMDVHDLVALPSSHDWVIPGLLETWQRLMLTAGEGLGKSTFLRQMLVCAAAGLHPFTHFEIDPVRCLALDFENPRRLTQRRYGALLRAADDSGSPVGRGMLEIVNQPAGTDLTRQGELAKVLRIVERIKPRLVMIGPLYRVQSGNPNDEEQASRVSDALDAIRDICDMAMMTETHTAKGNDGATGKRSLKPVGSGVWMRWPDYGLGLALSEGSDLIARAVDVVSWRGPRDEGEWPENLISGLAIGEPWPWKQISFDWRGRVADASPVPEEPDWAADTTY